MLGVSKPRTLSSSHEEQILHRAAVFAREIKLWLLWTQLGSAVHPAKQDLNWISVKSNSTKLQSTIVKWPLAKFELLDILEGQTLVIYHWHFRLYIKRLIWPVLFPWKNVPNPPSPSYPDHLALDSHGSGGGGQLKCWQWWSLTIAKEINFWEMKCYFYFFVANISLNSLHICVFHCLYRIMNECMTKHLVVGPLFNWMTPTLMKRGGGVTNGFEICSRDLIFAKNIVISLVISLVLLHPEMIQNAMNHDSW